MPSYRVSSSGHFPTVSDGHGTGHDGQPHPGTCGGILSEVGL